MRLPLRPRRVGYRTRTPADVQATTTLETIKSYVTQAEPGGGWVQIVFHRACDTCTETYRTTPALFNAFLDWLQPRAAHGTVVADGAAGGERQPVRCPSAAPAGRTPAPAGRHHRATTSDGVTVGVR